MHRHLAAWLLRYARRQVIVGLAVAWVAYNLLTNFVWAPPPGPERPLPPDLHWQYSPETLDRILGAWKSAQTRFLVGHLVVDNLYPWLYGALGALLLAALYRPARSEDLPWWVWGLPGVAILADTLENLLLSVLLWHYPARWDALARLAAWCTQVKWTAVALAAVLIVWGALQRGWRRSHLARVGPRGSA